MKIIILLVLTIYLPVCSAIEVKKLGAFEEELEQSFSVSIAEDYLSTSKFALEKADAKSGWKVFGNMGIGGASGSGFVGTGYISPTQGEAINNPYAAVVGSIGVRYPLFGTAAKEEKLIIEANKDVAVKESELKWVKKRLKLQLSQDYAAYWGGQQKERIAKAYIELLGLAEGILNRREAKGIVLKADRLEAISAFKRASYEIVNSQHVMRESVDSMIAYLGYDIVPFEAVKSLNNNIKIDSPLALENHHELKIIEALIDAQKDIITNNKFSGIESNFYIAHSVNLYTPETSLGAGVMTGLNVEIPLSVIKYRKAGEGMESATLRRLETEYLRKRKQLAGKADRFLHNERLTELIKYQEQHLDAVTELLREKSLRVEKLDGDVIESYLRALYEYYQVAIDLVDAQTEHWKMEGRLIEFFDKANGSGASINNKISIKPFQEAKVVLGASQVNPRTQFWGEGRGAIYLWNSRELLNKESPLFLLRLNEQGVSRVLLSLDARQINYYKTHPKKLNDFLQQAKSHFVEVDLLLGEPSWILPENREKLMEIIRSLSQFSFNALHLDLEINQLSIVLDLHSIYGAWLETVTLAVVESPWPVAISSHPRYLEKNYAGFDCFVCNLYEAGVSEVTVMDYVTNSVSVEKRLESLLTSYPMMKFSLAQSVEQELGQANSYATYPFDKFKNNMYSLQKNLKKQPNFLGLVIQSWRDLEEYLYENKVR